MLVFLTTQYGRKTIEPSLPAMPADLRARIRVMTYGEALRRRWLPAATYVFSDIERLTPVGAQQAARLWAHLSQSVPPVRLLNHPQRTMRRFRLLRMLFGTGFNAFNVYRCDDPSAFRFPVFVRIANDHEGARTGLLGDASELEVALRALEKAGRSRSNMMIVEFCDTADGRGIYRKYDAYIAGDRVIPADMYHGSNWMLKLGTCNIFEGEPMTDESLTVEQLHYLETFSRHKDLRDVCARASIEYGRVDFAYLGNRIQIWEINTNPDFGLAATLNPGYRDTPYGRDVFPIVNAATLSMLQSLDNPVDPRIRIPLDRMQAEDELTA